MKIDSLIYTQIRKKENLKKSLMSNSRVEEEKGRFRTAWEDGIVELQSMNRERKQK